MKKILFGLVLMGLTALPTLTYAQFEGQITMRIYSEDNGVSEANDLNLYATADRIMLKGEDNISTSDINLDASGILIRTDKKDFILFTEERVGFQFTKSNLEGLFTMIGLKGGDNSQVDSSTRSNFNYTNKEKEILGYKCTELRITSDENELEISVWLTSDIDINWGMLGEPWNNIPSNLQNSANQLTQEFKLSNFPMLINVENKNGESRKLFEVTNVNKSAIAKAMVEVPSGVNLKGFQELILSVMFGN